MRRRIIGATVLGVALVLLLSGCTAAARGRVVGHTSGEPIVGAVVTVSGESTRTDEAGAFALAGIDKGTATGSVTASGFPEVVFDLDFSKGDATSTVEIADVVVTISLRELAVEPQEVASATITLDGQPVSLTQSLTNVAPGSRTLVVQAPDHEPYSAAVEIVAGRNSLVATLSITPLETNRRYIDASKFHHVATAYKYVHPDERKKLSLKKWKKWNAASGETISVKFGKVRMHAKWKSKVTKKTYKDVAEIDRTIKAQLLGRTFTDNYSQYWVKRDGIWYILHRAIP